MASSSVGRVLDCIYKNTHTHTHIIYLLLVLAFFGVGAWEDEGGELYREGSGISRISFSRTAFTSDLRSLKDTSVMYYKCYVYVYKH